MRSPIVFITTAIIATVILVLIPITSLAESSKDTSTSASEMGAFWQYYYDADLKSYQLTFDWLSIPAIKGYSVEIASESGTLATKQIDTIRSAYTFKNIQPGDWFVNLAAQKRNGSWTKIFYWKITLPEPVLPTETPLPTPVDEEAVLGVRSSVESILNTLKQKQEDTTPQTATKKYSCNCDKSCRVIFSCTEAYFQLNSCGCAHLDADEDGIPCENKCKSEE